jgi:galactokinase
MPGIANALQGMGFSPSVISSKQSAFERCDRALDAWSAAGVGRIAAWVPGRIEVLGKHTDYAGGRSLLTAVDRGFVVRAAPRDDAQIRVVDLNGGLEFVTQLDRASAAADGDWSNYVATAVRRLARNFPHASRGMDLAFVSDLPVAAGVSSSSALLISVALTLSAINRLFADERWTIELPNRAAMASYLGAMENGLSFGALEGDTGVGTLGGFQDQTAILCAQPDRIVDFAWMPVTSLGSYDLPSGMRFVIASSGVLAEKTAGARERYNRVSRMVTHLLRAWNARYGRSDLSLASAAMSSAQAHDALRGIAASSATDEFSAVDLRARLDQFLLETFTLIPAAAQALSENDLVAFSRNVAESQRAAEQGLANQVPETRALVALAQRHGALAASAFGAGFGGSVWALVDERDLEQFEAAWSAAYRAQFPAAGATAMFFTTSAGPAAQLWSDAHDGSDTVVSLLP